MAPPDSIAVGTVRLGPVRLPNAAYMYDPSFLPPPHSPFPFSSHCASRWMCRRLRRHQMKHGNGFWPCEMYVIGVARVVIDLFLWWNTPAASADHPCFRGACYASRPAPSAHCHITRPPPLGPMLRPICRRTRLRLLAAELQSYARYTAVDRHAPRRWQYMRGRAACNRQWPCSCPNPS